jgi:hypothetical protein
MPSATKARHACRARRSVGPNAARRLLVDDDGFVPVLKEMARTLMTAVEGSGIAGEETP